MTTPVPQLLLAPNTPGEALMGRGQRPSLTSAKTHTWPIATLNS